MADRDLETRVLKNAAPDELAMQMFAHDRAQQVEMDMAHLKERGIFGFDSVDGRSRSFNLIRSKLLAVHRERSARLFGVVSATPNVGKSFITTNVAASLSRDPRYKTTLVDLDLRRGSSSALCGLSEQGTLLPFLMGDPTVQAPATFRFANQDLTIVPTNPQMIASAELLSSNRALQFFEAMRSSESGSLFMVDLPPAFANDDASVVINRLDAYVLVAEEGETTQRELNDVAAMLGREKLAGVIFNKYRGGLISDGYGADDYYGLGYTTTSG